MNVPSTNDLHYSFCPGPHYLVDDDRNIVGYLPAIKEVPLFKQEYTTIHNIRWYLGGA